MEFLYLTERCFQQGSKGYPADQRGDGNYRVSAASL